MKNTFSANEIVAVLQDDGYRAIYEVNELGNAAIKSGSQGLSWEIRILALDENSNLDTVLITYMEIVEHDIFPIGKICNDYNSSMNFGTASYAYSNEFLTAEESMLRLDLGASFTGGVTEEWFRTEIERWEICLAEFKKTIQINEETLSDDDDSI